MRVPLTTRDFLEQAELVYGDRVGIVDEPNQPAPSLGEVSYRDVARRGRALQAGLDSLGIGEGERVAIVSHNAARLLELLLSVPSAGRSPSRSTSGCRRRRSPTSSGTAAPGCCSSTRSWSPRSRAWRPSTGSARGGVRAAARLRYAEPRVWAEPDEDATATINYTSGTTARPRACR